MINITVSEKLWDGVRPASVKKTGLSEAIRTFEKKMPKAFDAPKAFDDATTTVKDLDAALAEAEDAVKKAKDDKKGAAAKLKGWRQECAKAQTTLTDERKQTGLVLAVKEADGMMKDLAKRVEDAITGAAQLVKDIDDGKLTDMKKASQELQDYRSAMRDSLKATQKDGFAEFIRTISTVLAWKVDPKEVPLPPEGKKIKDRIPVLEDQAEKARIAVEELLEESSQSRTGAAADLAKDLVADYRDMRKNLKGFIAPAKKFSSDVKIVGDKFKTLIGQGKTYDKLLPVLKTVHDKIMIADEKTMKEIARGRVASGDIQAERIRIRDSLKANKTLFQEFETIVGEEWNLCMTIYREVSEQMAEAHRQVDRVLRLVGESSPQAATECQKEGKKYDLEVQALKNKYMK
jgi:hypothetical protein